MKAIKNRLTTNWHLMRIMRLGIGILILVMGFQTKDWITGVLSAFFIFQAVTDTGCCGTSSCNIEGNTMPAGRIIDTDNGKQKIYEEIK
jgi:uncharacterized membrane protein HdeD (DUF308 family)